MNCPKCGTKINEADNFCAACGNEIAKNQEPIIYSFGPWGTGVCNGKPSFFTMIQKNNTTIELTDQKISGYSTLTKKPRFEIPYYQIISTEAFDYMLWKVLWVHYGDARGTVEISIMATTTTHQHILNIQNIIETHRKTEPP